MRRTVLDPRAHRGLLAAGLSLVLACDEEAEPMEVPSPGTQQSVGSTTDGGATQGPDLGTVTVEGDSGQPGADAGPGGCKTFDSSYAAIQELIFERHGCTAAACHGSAKVGGLDLSASASWDSLVDVASSNSKNKRVQPGQPADSFLYQKLQAATEPGSVQIAGSPMPIGATNVLTANELEALKLWIAKGAPKSGIVAEPTKNVDVGKLLDACLPAATPIKIKPLEPPPAEEGFQLVIPPFTLGANKEIEHCIPFVYDLTSKIPAQYKDEARNVIYTNGSRIRQDPQSHHLVIWNPQQDLNTLPANVSDWTCYGGPQNGKSCNPKTGGGECGAEGVCGGKPVPGTFCTEGSGALAPGGGDLFAQLAGLFGVLSVTGGSMPGQIASTQTPQQYTPPLEGVYTEIPLRGVFWFNSHAFNLTESDTLLEARVNYFYAKDRKREMKLKTDSSQVNIAEGTPPFTRKTFCAKHVVPQNYEIATLASHTHRRGEHFWVKDATGKQIYESFDYSDPAYTHFTPWLKFDQWDEASRTLEYCATFNNGLTKDDKPDLSLVTRASKMPERTSCTPIACVAGKVTAACTKDSDCDSAPGKGDGDCDACAIKGGATTENEMFALMPWYVFPAK